MKIHHSVDSFEQVEGAVVTIGTFDGVHHGHRQLIDRLKDIATQIHGSVVVLTFYPHPRSVLIDQRNPVQLLSSQREKIALLEKAGVDHLIIQAFDEQFASIEAGEFVEEVLCKRLKTSVLVVGYDHRFGKDRKGSFEDLERASSVQGFRLERISEQVIDQLTVSSTKVRKALISGDLETANGLLGYHYSIAGTVIHGQKLGRQLGFPTANILPESQDKLIPAEGVYVVNTLVRGRHVHGLLSIGRRPTVDDSGKLSIEVYLLDFNDDIYREFIEVQLLKRLRGDMKFGSLELLVEQMNRDVADARVFFNAQ